MAVPSSTVTRWYAGDPMLQPIVLLGTAGDFDDVLVSTDDEDVGIGCCAWGSAYGRLGAVHYARTPDGEMEECCTYG